MTTPRFPIIGFLALLALLAGGPLFFGRLNQVALWTQEFRDDGAVFTGHGAGQPPIEVLHVFRGLGPLMYEERAAAPAGDVDGDGRADLFLLAPFRAGDGGGTLNLRSGATAKSLHRWILPDVDQEPGRVETVGDVDI